MLAKHGTVDICDGIHDAVGESVIIVASTRPDRQQKKGMYQQKWEQIQQEKCGASTGQNSWMETLLCGDSTVGRGCNAWIMKQDLAYQGSRVKV